jgi:hypothetical protein
LRSWMQLVSCHLLCHLPICSSVSLVDVLTSVSIYILFFTIPSSGIRCKWPNQLNLCAFM